MYDRAAIIGFAVDRPPPNDTAMIPSPNVVSIKRCTFAGNTNTGTGGTANFKALLSFADFFEVDIEDVCFDDNGTPSGSLMEIESLDSTVAGVYSMDGTAVALGDPECMGSVLIASTEVATTCVSPDASSCFDEEITMMDPSAAPTPVPDIQTGAPTAGSSGFTLLLGGVAKLASALAFVLSFD